jgi:hypothetical protein
MYTQLGHYVEAACNDDLATFNTSGFTQAVKTKTPAAPLTVGWNDPIQSLRGFYATTRKSYHEALLQFLQKLIGWGLSAIAISLGAPFWFDLLSKLVNLRHSGQKPLSTART